LPEDNVLGLFEQMGIEFASSVVDLVSRDMGLVFPSLVGLVDTHIGLPDCRSSRIFRVGGAVSVEQSPVNQSVGLGHPLLLVEGGGTGFCLRLPASLVTPLLYFLKRLSDRIRIGVHHPVDQTLGHLGYGPEAIASLGLLLGLLNQLSLELLVLKQEVLGLHPVLLGGPGGVRVVLVQGLVLLGKLGGLLGQLFIRGRFGLEFSYARPGWSVPALRLAALSGACSFRLWACVRYRFSHGLSSFQVLDTAG
jgi:hypothetical protein